MPAGQLDITVVSADGLRQVELVSETHAGRAGRLVPGGSFNAANRPRRSLKLVRTRVGQLGSLSYLCRERLATTSDTTVLYTPALIL